jgi:hypothetical protein
MFNVCNAVSACVPACPAIKVQLAHLSSAAVITLMQQQQQQPLLLRHSHG